MRSAPPSRPDPDRRRLVHGLVVRSPRPTGEAQVAEEMPRRNAPPRIRPGADPAGFSAGGWGRERGEETPRDVCLGAGIDEGRARVVEKLGERRPSRGDERQPRGKRLERGATRAFLERGERETARQAQ